MIEFSCQHRGDRLRVEKCGRCGRGGQAADVFACRLHGECTVNAYGLRSGGKRRRGPKLPVCIACDDRQPARADESA